MKRNCRKLHSRIKISGEHKTYVSFRRVLIYLLWFRIFFRILIFKTRVSKNNSRGIYHINSTSTHNKIFGWNNMATVRKACAWTSKLRGKGGNSYLKLRIRYSYNLLLCYDQYWNPRNYLVLRESILGSIWGSTQGSPLASICWIHILYQPEGTTHFIVVTMESELTNTYSLPWYVMSLITN